MKIAAIQMRSGLDPEANLAALEPLLAEAADRGAAYALTPEVTLIFPEKPRAAQGGGRALRGASASGPGGRDGP